MPRRGPLLALLVLGMSTRLPAWADEGPPGFSRFYAENKHRVTRDGTLETVYRRATRTHVGAMLRENADECLGGALGVGLAAVSRIKKLRPALKMAWNGLRAKTVGEAAYDVGIRDPKDRKQSIGAHAADLANMALWMIPGVKKVMPKVFAAQLCKAAYDGAMAVKERMCLARCELLTSARQAGIETLDRRLFDSYRDKLREMQQQHRAAKDKAVADLKYHRPLLARARAQCDREQSALRQTPPFLRQIWHEERAKSALTTAREEKRAMETMQRVLERMDQVAPPADR